MIKPNLYSVEIRGRIKSVTILPSIHPIQRAKGIPHDEYTQAIEWLHSF